MDASFGLYAQHGPRRFPEARQRQGLALSKPEKLQDIFNPPSWTLPLRDEELAGRTASWALPLGTVGAASRRHHLSAP